MMLKDNFMAKDFGHYKATALLAKKTRSHIYLAQTSLGPERNVVIKVFTSRRLSSMQDQTKFMQEIRALVELKHPHVFTFLDAGFEDERPFLVMDYAARTSLREQLQHRGSASLTIKASIMLLSQLGQALEYIHQQKLIHGNIKPENILFTARGRTLLSDMSITPILDTLDPVHRSFLDISPYQAPEQLMQQGSVESDQYGLACIAYELFTGRPPFAASDPLLRQKILTNDPIAPTHFNPTIDQALEYVLLKALAKQPTDRYDTVTHFIEALQIASGIAMSSEANSTPSVFSEILSAFPGQAHLSSSLNTTQTQTSQISTELSAVDSQALRRVDASPDGLLKHAKKSSGLRLLLISIACLIILLTSSILYLSVPPSANKLHSLVVSPTNSMSHLSTRGSVPTRVPPVAVTPAVQAKRQPVITVTSQPTSVPAALPSATPTPAPGVLLADDPFNASTGVLNAVNSGSGWGGAWVTQNGDTSVPGYDIRSTSMLHYANLRIQGNYAIGGVAYLTAGRQLDVSGSGPFNAYLNNNGLIGRTGTTLWLSTLMRKDIDNGEEMSITLHAGSIVTYPHPPLVGMGYFGTGSSGNNPHNWGLSIGGTIYRTGVPLVVGRTSLLVMRIDFGPTNTISFYVNPTTLGGYPPASATFQTTTSLDLAFQSLAYYAGNVTNDSSLGEVRFGTSYASVTPI